MEHLQSYFKKNPVIAGIRNKKSLLKALNSNLIALFILYGNIMDLPDIMNKARKHDKLIFLHIDLIRGIAQDKEGVEYLANNNLCDGIVSTKSNLIKVAMKNDLMAIQRLFLLDSAALKTGKHFLLNNQPDAVEILPGIAAPYFIKHIQKKHLCPVIAGGLIRTREEVKKIVKKGALAVSTSNSELWNWK
ncbi:MAG: glycerol-3-phosphate responsive antiterminator [Halanaerobiaceae bacterium]